jgi:seryl-tRNA synthetase
MLDVLDFIAERGGNPEKIRESQRHRYADEKIVDDIIALWQDHRKSMSEPLSTRFGKTADTLPANYDSFQVKTKINDVQKQIGAKKKVSFSRSRPLVGEEHAD